MQAIQDIASVSLAKGRFEVVLRIFTKLLKGLETLPKDNEQLKYAKGATLHNIGVIHLWSGRYEEAVDWFQRAVDERMKKLPEQHPDIVVSLYRKAMASFALGRIDGAISVLESSLAMIPSGHMVAGKVLNNLGVLCFQKRDFSAALKEFTKSLEIQRLWLQDPIKRQVTVHDISVTLCNMGNLYLERSDFDLAFYVFEEAVLLQTTVFRNDHSIVLSSRTSLAIAKARSSDVNKALQILLGCLRSQNTRFGPTSADATETVGLCGLLHASQGDYESALKCFFAVRKWQKVNLPDSNPAHRKVKECIKAIEDLLDTNKVPSPAKVWV
jgi:tetratricopeptide (TPR) repeat protein